MDYIVKKIDSKDAMEIITTKHWSDTSFLKIRCLLITARGMTDEESDSAVDEMSFIFHNVIPFINDNLGRNKDKN